ncbi:PP2C family protein-serine/threonine phosphatase [Actinomadura yumaensis]|uniref:PP2C family protein-serine/threonine phosphatase n=1 Tax=Actinomadura yumaensis TaxID=111807 RepID=A0ABW2CLD5_9ACTN
MEAARVEAVRRYDILDTPPDGAFDRVAAMAARWFDTPMATVAIVDTDRIWFKAVHGLAGVAQIGRDPGLCASAILNDEPLVVPDALTDPLARANPLVTGDMKIRFYAAAPIITADGHRLGTVNVLDTRPRTITAADTAMLRDLAAMVADQLELRLSALSRLRTERRLRAQAERDKADLEEFAGTLQRTLLPPALPRIPGMGLASHYRTASTREVGGDFYDVFALGADRWAFFLGDVCGKGAAAAAVTSLIRYTLRAAALHDPDPAAVLAELNTALLLDPAHGGRFCTAVFGTITPAPTGGFTVHLGTGGHPTVMVLRAPAHSGPVHDGAGTGGTGNGGTGNGGAADNGERLRAEPARITGGMLVGALEEATFADTRLVLDPGDGLLLYTDGLIEADTDGTGAMLGEAGLVELLNRPPLPPPALRTGPENTAFPHPATQLVDRLTAVLDGFASNDDDVALLAMTALNAPHACPDGGGTGARASTGHAAAPPATQPREPSL